MVAVIPSQFQWIAEMARASERQDSLHRLPFLSHSLPYFLHDGGRTHLFDSLGQWRPIWRPFLWRSFPWPTFFPVSGICRRIGICKRSYHFDLFTTSLKFRFSKQVTRISALARYSPIVVRPPWTITESRWTIFWWACTASIMRARCNFSLLIFCRKFSDFLLSVWGSFTSWSN